MRKRHVALLAGVGLAVLAGGVGWLNRESIVTHYVDRTLRASGVDARYRFEQVGVGVQRLRDVSIGDPANPDLTAREVVLRLGVGWSGPVIAGVEARGVRLKGRWTGERLTLGQIDRLMPEETDEPFEFPNIFLDLVDTAMRLDTPWGVIGIGIDGAGNPKRLFSGAVAARAPALEAGDCRAVNISGRVRVTVRAGDPGARGPLGLDRLDCPALRLAASDLRIGVEGEARGGLADWRLAAGLRGGAAQAAGATAAALQGRLSLAAAPADAISADWSIAALRGDSPWIGARRIVLEGRGRRDGDGAIGADGTLSLDGGRGGRAALASIAALGGWDDTTPVGPLARKAGAALDAAARGFAGNAAFTLARDSGGTTRVRLGSASLTADSGARLEVAGPNPLSWQDGAISFDTASRIGGGGLPEGELALRRPTPQAPVEGEARFAPYATRDAVVALAPLRFTAAPDGTARFVTGIALSGPLAGGRVERFALPLAGRLERDGTLAISGECRAARWHAIYTPALSLDPGALALCGADGGPLVSIGPRGMGGAVRLPAFALTGRAGSSPLRIAGGGAEIGLGRRGFTFTDMSVVLGEGDSPVRIAAARLAGNVGHQGFAGGFSGMAGNIGSVPFLLSEGEGDWRLTDGVLSLDGAIRVDDAAAVDRFQPLQSRDVALRFADGRIDVTGRLDNIARGDAVADVVIAHRLETGMGDARFTVPGIRFARDGTQPVDISRLALGVIANAEGRVHGQGEVRWGPEGVIGSTGAFTTDSFDFAAAFGPVERLAGTIRFNDLVGLATAPGQQVTLGSVNPGIEVLDGRVAYQLLPGQQVRIEGGRWPFAGGSLLLQPALLDFSAQHPRRLTFDVSNVDAGLFLQRYEFDNISATGTFDGVLPTVFDKDGGRVDGGTLVSRSGGTLAYVGELSNRDLGFMGNMAFGALKSLRYDNLAIRMNGRIDGEMLTEIGFSGLAQGEGARNNVLTRWLAGLPFTFSIRIAAPFRQLLTSARGLYDPAVLIEQNLPALLRAEGEDAEAAAATSQPGATSPVQPSESEDRR